MKPTKEVAKGQIRVKPSVRARLKVEAAKNKVTMADLVEMSLNVYLKLRGKYKLK